VPQPLNLNVRRKGNTVFTLEHHDGEIKYEFKKGGFAIVNSKLYISIETNVINDDDFPDRFLLAIDGYPLNRSLESCRIRMSTNPNDEPPNIYVYTTFHALEVEAIIDLNVISENEIAVILSVTSDDANNYNEKAKPSLFKGEVKLLRKKIGDMWIPT
jgi:hypothetical protein